MKTPSAPLRPAQSWWLLAAASTIFLTLSPHLPAWLALSAATVFLWRGMLIYRRKPPATRWVLIFLACGGIVGIQLHYHTLFGQNPGMGLLAMLLALKLHEAGTRRDGMTVVMLSYFIALGTFFYAQHIGNALAMIGGVVLTTTTLLALTDDRLPTRQLLRNASVLLAQATPFLLVLFLLFPRVSGPLWGLPRDAHNALSGLSDSMAPGSISQLSLSDAVAFRVKFDGVLPSRDQLYWRGPVLTRFDGRQWRAVLVDVAPTLPYAVDDTHTGVDYEVTLEPHNKPWIFALELPTRLPADKLMVRDYLVVAREPVVQRERYRVRSQPGLEAGLSESRFMIDIARLLPPQSNPRTQTLGRTWRAASDSDEDVLRHALDFFRRQNLTYTLSPPLLGEHTADEFLFDTRQGFCEHFSSAFVIALRAAGVPARVVTGYQGGELNPVDGYFTVRQSDAHAWAEVWLNRHGWVRIDPTAASFPARIDMNLAAAVPAGDPLPFLMRTDLAWLRDMRFRWDAASNAWNQWILGYTPQRQRDLLEKWGMPRPDWRRMTFALAGLCGVLLIGLTAWAIYHRKRPDPVQSLWLRCSRRLDSCGLGRLPWEGPLDYAQRVATARPDLATKIQRIAKLYAALRYGRRSRGSIVELRRLITDLSP